jgi:hypothetical protein
LGGLAEKDFERPTVEAAMNITEFLLCEYNTGSFPRGIAMMITALQAWLYDRNSMAPLAFEKPLVRKSCPRARQISASWLTPWRSSPGTETSWCWARGMPSPRRTPGGSRLCGPDFEMG